MDKTLSGNPNLMTTALRLLYIDNILYNYINTTHKEKGLWKTVCSHRPPFSTCFWGLKGGGGAHPLHPTPHPRSATGVLGPISYPWPGIPSWVNSFWFPIAGEGLTMGPHSDKLVLLLYKDNLQGS